MSNWEYWVPYEDTVEEIPEKVSIPQFIANWLSYCKSTNVNLLMAIKVNEEELYNYARQKEADQIKDFLEDEENIEVFAKAWLYSYDIKKEKLYTVEIPNPNKIGNEVIVLMMNGFKEIVIKKEFGSR